MNVKKTLPPNGNYANEQAALELKGNKLGYLFGNWTGRAKSLYIFKYDFINSSK
jgi:hypothetical protein